jgi:hypothetical protein
MYRPRVRPPRKPSIAAVLALAVTAAGCFTTTADFRDDAEEFIRTNEELRTKAGTTFDRATCEEPPDRAVGTTFPCRAVDAEGRTWTFEIEILGDSEYRVDVDRRP